MTVEIQIQGRMISTTFEHLFIFINALFVPRLETHRVENVSYLNMRVRMPQIFFSENRFFFWSIVEISLLPH